MLRITKNYFLLFDTHRNENMLQAKLDIEVKNTFYATERFFCSMSRS
jgi:hypothetical protein